MGPNCCSSEGRLQLLWAIIGELMSTITSCRLSHDESCDCSQPRQLDLSPLAPYMSGFSKLIKTTTKKNHL